MENISNVSSEEELLQLRNEGKISEDEYEDLLKTLQKPAEIDAVSAVQDSGQQARTSGLAIASLVLSLLGTLGCIPGILCGHLATRKIKKDPTVQGHRLALAGLIVGYTMLILSIVAVIIWLSVMHLTDSDDLGLMETEEIELKHFPIDDVEGIITRSGVRFDKEISSDGNGSLRITATEPTVIRLFETGDIDIENARLIYRAHIRTENVEGQVYLEMWCHFTGVGDFFSRGLMTPLTGTADWTIEETPFFLKKAQNPDRVKLNLVINGKGTAWIDDIRLMKGPLKL
ncbi:MAG: DUF4190 domain-containing protein [Planctomycetota bacterium]|jgi:hypothetical protein